MFFENLMFTELLRHWGLFFNTVTVRTARTGQVAGRCLHVASRVWGYGRVLTGRVGGFRFFCFFSFVFGAFSVT